MAWYPYKSTVGQRVQSDDSPQDMGFVAHYQCTPAALDEDGYVVSENMHVGAYTLAAASPGDGAAHGITLERTVAGGADTPGTIVVTGTDLAGAVITETITPGAHATTVYGTKAFATVTSVVGEGWVIADAADTLVVGWGDIIGLPHMLPHNTVLAACLGDAREATAPTVVASATVLSDNTVDLDSALNATVVDLYYIV